MTTLDIKPILTKIGFYDNVNTTPDHQIASPVPIDKINKLILELSLTGLEHSAPGYDEPKFIPFYLNILLFYREGGKGGLVYSNYSVPVKSYNAEKRFDLLVDLFGDEKLQAAQFKQDLSYTFFNCSIFFSEQELDTEEQIMKHYNNSYYTLYSSKLPLIGGGIDA
jgi:hypothetical protein